MLVDMYPCSCFVVGLHLRLIMERRGGQKVYLISFIN